MDAALPRALSRFLALPRSPFPSPSFVLSSHPLCLAPAFLQRPSDFVTSPSLQPPARISLIHLVLLPAFPEFVLSVGHLGTRTRVRPRARQRGLRGGWGKAASIGGMAGRAQGGHGTKATGVAGMEVSFPGRGCVETSAGPRKSNAGKGAPRRRQVKARSVPWMSQGASWLGCRM